MAAPGLENLALSESMHPIPRQNRINQSKPVFMRKLFFLVSLLILALVIWLGVFRSAPSTPFAPVVTQPLAAKQPTAREIVLTPLGGKTKADEEIAKLQRRVKDSTPDQSPALLENLGWAFVNKARTSSDPGFYKLAEQCADAIAVVNPGSADGELLRGHIYHALHRFQDAEQVARKLVAQRTFVFDYALLGDALMEQGKLDEAVEAYQKMVDLKPSLQTYSRVAHMRWLKGDLPGAIRAIEVAVSSGSIREPEPVAWALTKLALYELQSGEKDLALRATEAATRYLPDYAAAELMRGRILLAEGKTAEAITSLEAAAKKSPLPEYLWTLADALRADGKVTQATAVETQLHNTGVANDPRTYSLYLASRGDHPALALRLAKEELENRRDIFTYDAVAWAELAHGDAPAAEKAIQSALAEGTKDGRLFYHAAVIAAAAGKTADAQTYFTKAKALEQTLMPSERSALEQKIALLSSPQAQVSSR